MIWELFRAGESPHKNFSSNAHLKKDLEHPKNGHFSIFKKIDPNRPLSMWGPQRGQMCSKHFFDGLSVLFAQFWPRKCLFTKNWEKAQNRPSEANFLRSWPWAQHLKKWLKTVDFGVKSQFVVKRHVLGQNGLIKTIRPLKKCFEHFLCLFWDPFQMAIFWLATPCEGQNGHFWMSIARRTADRLS